MQRSVTEGRTCEHSQLLLEKVKLGTGGRRWVKVEAKYGHLRRSAEVRRRKVEALQE